MGYLIKRSGNDWLYRRSITDHWLKAWCEGVGPESEVVRITIVRILCAVLLIGSSIYAYSEYKHAETAGARAVCTEIDNVLTFALDRAVTLAKFDERYPVQNQAGQVIKYKDAITQMREENNKALIAAYTHLQTLELDYLKHLSACENYKDYHAVVYLARFGLGL